MSSELEVDVGALSEPPALAVRLLAAAAGPLLAAAILGDFAEEYAARLAAEGPAAARRWYLREVVRSAPALAGYQLRRRFMIWFQERDTKLALLALLCLLPAALLLTGGLLQSGFGYSGFTDAFAAVSSVLFSPLLILGGIVAANLLVILPIIQLHASREKGYVQGSVKVRVRWLNLAIIGASAVFAAMIFTYLLVENLALVATHAGF